MYKYLIISYTLFLFAMPVSSARQEREIPRQIFTTAEQMPSFPGGIKGMQRFMDKHLEYPENAMKNHIQGRVILQFIVEPDGRLSDIKILQSLDPDCDKEALRVIGKMPRWDPGVQESVPVAVYYTLPVIFRLF